VAVPLIGTVCGLLAALSVRMNVAERAPDAVGENVIETLQLVPAASVTPEQPSLDCVKSSAFAPRVAALLMNSGALPVFVTVIDCGVLVVPIACAANVSDVGANVTAGAVVAGVKSRRLRRLHRCRDRRPRRRAAPTRSVLYVRTTRCACAENRSLAPPR